MPLRVASWAERGQLGTKFQPLQGRESGGNAELDYAGTLPIDGEDGERNRRLLERLRSLSRLLRETMGIFYVTLEPSPVTTTVDDDDARGKYANLFLLKFKMKSELFEAQLHFSYEESQRGAYGEDLSEDVTYSLGEMELKGPTTLRPIGFVQTAVIYSSSARQYVKRDDVVECRALRSVVLDIVSRMKGILKANRLRHTETQISASVAAKFINLPAETQQEIVGLYKRYIEADLNENLKLLSFRSTGI